MQKRRTYWIHKPLTRPLRFTRKDRDRNNWRIFTALSLPSPRRGEGAAESHSFRRPKPDYSPLALPGSLFDPDERVGLALGDCGCLGRQSSCDPLTAGSLFSQFDLRPGTIGGAGEPLVACPLVSERRGLQAVHGTRYNRPFGGYAISPEARLAKVLGNAHTRLRRRPALGIRLIVLRGFPNWEMAPESSASRQGDETSDQRSLAVRVRRRHAARESFAPPQRQPLRRPFSARSPWRPNGPRAQRAAGRRVHRHGRPGRAHIGICTDLKARGRCDTVAVCDVLRSPLRAAAARTGGKIYRNYRELLADPASIWSASRRQIGTTLRRPSTRCGRQRRVRGKAAHALVPDGSGAASWARRLPGAGGSSRWARNTWPTTPTPRRRN